MDLADPLYQFSAGSPLGTISHALLDFDGGWHL